MSVPTSCFFFSSRRRHTRSTRDWSSDVCSSDLGEAAVALTENLRPDLVILDIKMPVLDGITAAERIAADHLAPVVILTAGSQRELVERARDAGAMAYLIKPFTKADLVPAIEI